MLILTVESREDLRSVETGTLEVGLPEVTAAELTRLRVLDSGQPLPEDQRGVAVNAALSAFERGCSLLVVGDRRITELEEELRVGGETRV